MSDKTKLINEIIENNPELSQDKKSLEKLFDLLMENNPNIKAWEDFKESLKYKLEMFYNKKEPSIKKLTFITALIQTFSLAFVIGAYYYFIWGIEFFSKNTQINNPIIQNIDNKQEIQEELSTFDISDDNNLIENEKNTLINTANDTIIQQSIPNKKEPLISNNDNFKNIEVLKNDENIQVSDNQIVDNQIVDLLWEEDSNSSTINSIWWSMMMKSSISNVDLQEDNKVENFVEKSNDNLDQNLSFKDYCINNFWELLVIDNLKICVLDKKQCQEKDFIDWVCNFVEIK